MKMLIAAGAALVSATLFGATPMGPSGAEKAAFAAETKSPVVLDGVLDEPVWKVAPPETQLTAMTGLPLAADDDRTTELRFAFDEKYVYIAATCRVREDMPSATKTGEVRRQGGGKWENVLEIYLDPGRTMYHFTGVWIYSDGTNFGMTDFQHRDPPSGIRYASRTDGRIWTVELAFPAEGKTHVGGQWGFDLIRYAPGAGILGMWKVITSAFQTPDSFGRVLLGLPSEWFAANEKRLASDLDAAEKVLKGGAYDARLAAVRREIREIGADGIRALPMYDGVAAKVARLVDTATFKKITEER